MLSKRSSQQCWRYGLTAVVVLVGAGLARSAEPDPLQAAKKEVEKAVAAQKAAHDEWNAKEMARSATREICVVARGTAEKACQDRAAALALLKQRRSAVETTRAELAACTDASLRETLEQKLAKAASAVADAEKQVAQRTATARSSAERMIIDQDVGNRAVESLLAIESKLGERLADIRKAERKVLALEAEAANCACEKAGKEKAAGAKAAADKAKAACKALREADTVALWEVQQWLGVQRGTLDQSSGGNHHAAHVARSLAAEEPDAQWKKTLEEFAARTSALCAAQQQASAQKSAAIDAMVAQIYPLRAVAWGGLKPLKPEQFDYAKARHLLVRAGFGGTPEEVARLQKMGLYKAVNHLVDYYRQPAAAVPFDATPPLPGDPLEGKLRNGFIQGQVVGPRHAANNDQLNRLRHWWLRRMVESPRPLQEKLVLFWHGHFATQYSVVHNSYMIYQQNQLFREQAAGNFASLLYGIVHDPVMIRYLDNNTNVKGHANENLAREIMELFAMGAFQGYNEKDIREAARALTGYTFDGHSGQFRYLADKHDGGPKTVFGKTGNYTGDDVVALILQQPVTPRFIAKKLFEYFAYAEPRQEVIEQLAAVLQENRYELNPLLKNLFLSEEFYTPKAMGTQIKCPVQLVVGTLRDLGVKQLPDAGPVDHAVREMGQNLFEPPDVKGWRYGRPWINSSRIFVRYNDVANMIRTIPRKGGSGVDVMTLVKKGNCQNTDDVVKYLARSCLVRSLTPQQTQQLCDYLGTLPPRAEWDAQRDALNAKLQGVLVLMTSLPEYQLY